MIKFGMALMEIVEQLTKGYIKATGKQPGNLEKLKIQEEAIKRFKDMNKVVDMKGNPINPAEGIMGGEQAQNFSKIKDPALYEDRGGNIIPAQFDESPAFPSYTAKETEEQIRQRLLKNNKDGIASMKSKLDDPEKKADGGRIGLKSGMTKRAFLKLMGAGAAGVAGLKSGMLGFGGKKAATEVAKEVATSGAPPPHFLKLVAKIKALGDDAPKLAVKDREVITKYKDYTLTEDVTTGEQTIQRMKIDDDLKYDASEYYGKPIGEEVYMSYRPGKGQVDETMKGKTPPDEYSEDTSLIRSDRPAEGEIMETTSGVPDDIFEEVGEAVPEAIRKEKADGGRMGYKVGSSKKGVQSLIDLVKNKFGKESITTADKIPVPNDTLKRNMFKKFDNRNPDPKKQMTDSEYEDFVEEVGGEDQLEGYSFDGTIGDAQRILKEQENYMEYMYDQYKTGKLDPVAGDKSPARKKLLQKRFEDMEASGDSRLMTREEIEELTFFDLGTEMDEAAKKASKVDDDIDISQGMIDLDEMNFTKNAQAAKKAMDEASNKTLPEIDEKLLKNYSKEIKAGVAKIMGDTSPEGLEKSIEIDNLMLKYPGISIDFADQIASSSPTMKADMIAMVEQAFKMDEIGMSGDEIIDSFKNTKRTKQANGGLSYLMGM